MAKTMLSLIWTFRVKLFGAQLIPLSMKVHCHLSARPFTFLSILGAVHPKLKLRPPIFHHVLALFVFVSPSEFAQNL